MRALLVLALLTTCVSAIGLHSLPRNFVFGAGTASYQIEGAVSQDGREPSIWDVFSHTPGKTAGGDTGDLADDSYNLFELDVALMRAMNLPAFRFSLSWSRLVRADGSVNQAGINHYNALINALLDSNVTPYVTLYHWDLPVAFSTYNQQGDWLNATYITPLFVQYADVAFSAFGDRVKHWFTFNEPLTFCFLGYESGVHAPGRCSDRSKCDAGNSAIEPYQCIHSVNLAHVHAVSLYRAKYAPSQQGKIGITLNVGWAEPATDDPRDHEAAEIAMRFDAGAWADPIFKGDYSQLMKERCGKLLPQFTDAEKNMFRANIPDYWGLNFYTSAYAYHVDQAAPPGTGWFSDRNVTTSALSPNGTAIGVQADSPWLYSTPWGLRKMLLWIAQQYPAFPIFVTENGMDVVEENSKPLQAALRDADRVQFMNDYLTETGNAIDAGAPVAGYFYWSLLDNYEWADGYSKRFGMHYVDYGNSLARYPKDSARWYSELIRNVTGRAVAEDESSSARRAASERR